MLRTDNASSKSQYPGARGLGSSGMKAQRGWCAVSQGRPRDMYVMRTEDDWRPVFTVGETFSRD
jgi:hypothetical protein